MRKLVQEEGLTIPLWSGTAKTGEQHQEIPGIIPLELKSQERAKTAGEPDYSDESWQRILKNSPWQPRDYKRYTMEDVKRVHRKQRLTYIEYKIIRKLTWRQRRFIRTQWRKRVAQPISLAVAIAAEAKREFSS